MKKHPAIALIEFAHIPVGIEAGDAMLKQAPISLSTLLRILPHPETSFLGEENGSRGNLQNLSQFVSQGRTVSNPSAVPLSSNTRRLSGTMNLSIV